MEVEFLNSSISAHWRLFILHLDWIEIIFLFGNQNMLLNQSATGVFLTYKNIIGGSFINLGIGLLCFVIKWCFTWDPHRFRLYGWSRKNISLKQRSKILLFPIKLKSKNSKKIKFGKKIELKALELLYKRNIWFENSINQVLFFFVQFG